MKLVAYGEADRYAFEELYCVTCSHYNQKPLITIQYGH